MEDAKLPNPTDYTTDIEAMFMSELKAILDTRLSKIMATITQIPTHY